jgi:hypothetical protein
LTINTTSSSAWQKRRSDFNHDWLQNKFIMTLADWSKSIDKERWIDCTQQSFEDEIVIAWNANYSQISLLMSDYRKSMSPRVLLENGTIKRMTPPWRNLLGEILHSLWMARCNVLARSRKVIDAYTTADKVYQSLNTEFPKALAAKDKELLKSMFDIFRGHCQVLRNTVTALESSIRVT